MMEKFILGEFIVFLTIKSIYIKKRAIAKDMEFVKNKVISAR